MSNKYHKNCGGEVVYREGDPDAYYEYAGFCLKCEDFPIAEENIIFKLEDGKFETFSHEKQKWIIINSINEVMK